MAPSDGIDDDYRLAVGGLIIEMARLDSKLTDLIIAVTGMHVMHALTFVHHQQFSNKWAGIVALYRLIYPEETDWKATEAYAVLNRIKAVADFRNTLAHAMWHVDDFGVPHAVRFAARGELTRSRRPVPVEQVQEHVREAVQLQSRVDILAESDRGLGTFAHRS
jgi:hypothetical protein